MGFLDWIKNFGETRDRSLQRRSQLEQIRQTEIQREMLEEMRRRPLCNSMPEFMKCAKCEQLESCNAGYDYYLRRTQEGWRVLFGGCPPTDEELLPTWKKMVREQQEEVDRLKKEGRGFFDSELRASQELLKGIKDFEKYSTRLSVLTAWEIALEDAENPFSACDHLVTWHPRYKVCSKCMNKNWCTLKSDVDIGASINSPYFEESERIKTVVSG